MDETAGKGGMSVERLKDKRMKWEGFIPVDHKEYKAILRQEKSTAKQIYRRLLEIENILGDDYDLDRLRELVELAKNIPHVCRFCVGCEMEPKDGHGCDEYDSFVFSTRYLRELVEADR